MSGSRATCKLRPQAITFNLAQSFAYILLFLGWASPEYRLTVSKDFRCIATQADVGNGAIPSHHRSISRIDNFIGHKHTISDLHVDMQAELVHVLM